MCRTQEGHHNQPGGGRRLLHLGQEVLMRGPMVTGQRIIPRTRTSRSCKQRLRNWRQPKELHHHLTLLVTDTLAKKEPRDKWHEGMNFDCCHRKTLFLMRLMNVKVTWFAMFWNLKYQAWNSNIGYYTFQTRAQGRGDAAKTNIVREWRWAGRMALKTAK